MQYVTMARHGKEPYPLFSFTQGEAGTHEEDMPTRVVTLEQLPECLLPLTRILREGGLEVLSLVLDGTYYLVEKLRESDRPSWCKPLVKEVCRD